jgi:hypothetical protein
MLKASSDPYLKGNAVPLHTTCFTKNGLGLKSKYGVRLLGEECMG